MSRLTPTSSQALTTAFKKKKVTIPVGSEDLGVWNILCVWDPRTCTKYGNDSRTPPSGIISLIGHHSNRTAAILVGYHPNRVRGFGGLEYPCVWDSRTCPKYGNDSRTPPFPIILLESLLRTMTHHYVPTCHYVPVRAITYLRTPAYH